MEKMEKEANSLRRETLEIWKEMGLGKLNGGPQKKDHGFGWVLDVRGILHLRWR